MSAAADEQLVWSRTSTLALAAPRQCVLEVTGTDRLSWLNGLLTCDLSKRGEGDVVQGLALAQKGKIVSDVVAVVAKERVLLIVQRRTVDGLVASFEHHLMMEDAELHRGSDIPWFLHGPLAARALASAREAGGTGGVLDITGSGGAVVVTTSGGASEAAMLAAVHDAGGGVGDDAGWDVVRVLAGVPRFDVDFDDTTYPQEAGLETSAVSFEKGCYLGQEVVCMLQMRGHVKRKLVSLAVASADPPGAHTAVQDAKAVAIGEVTSSARAGESETRALAMLKYAFIASGTEVTVDGHSARVV